ncbi:MAG: transketolase [Sedimentisphaerales bacterium]|nr:transketolase [Sedimentisphaerales bacterium]
MTDDELKIKSIHYRKKLLEYIKKAGAGHTGGSLSCVDILNVLYNRIMNISPQNFGDPARDRYVQSKGHSVEALYVVLADKGFFPESDLETLCKYRSHYVGHPTRKVNGIEHNSGALGHGLAFGAGVALSAKKDKAAYKVYVLLGDGELVEGSNWETFMAAAHYRLDNLTAIVDRNNLQITGKTEDVCGLERLDEKFRAFGWHVEIVDGHDIAALSDVLGKVPFKTDKPSLVIANTIKGKGVSFIENDHTWHHHVPTDSQYRQAQLELDNLLTELGS